MLLQLTQVMQENTKELQSQLKESLSLREIEYGEESMFNIGKQSLAAIKQELFLSSGHGQLQGERPKQAIVVLEKRLSQLRDSLDVVDDDDPAKSLKKKVIAELQRKLDSLVAPSFPHSQKEHICGREPCIQIHLFYRYEKERKRKRQFRHRRKSDR